MFSTYDDWKLRADRDDDWWNEPEPEPEEEISMTDIVERLRDVHVKSMKTCFEAADEIERLRKERDELLRLTTVIAAKKLEAEIERLREYEASFQMHWDADQKGIKLWQEAHPGSDLTWPDHAEMVAWMLGEIERLREDLSYAKQELMFAQALAVQTAGLDGDAKRSDALEEAARVAEGWFTRDGALAEADDAKHDIAAHIRALKEKNQGD